MDGPGPSTVAHFHDRVARDTGDRLLVGPWEVIILAARALGNALRDAGGDIFVLRVDQKELHVHGANAVSNREHLILEDLFGHLFHAAFLVHRHILALAHGQRHVRAPIGDRYHADLPDVRALQRVLPRSNRLRQGVRERCATTARQHLHASARPRHRRRRGHEHFCADAAAWNEAHLVTALIRGLEKAEDCTLGVLHSIQCHGAAGVDHEDYQGASLARHLFHPDVALLHVDLLQLLGLALFQGFFAANLLEDHSSPQRRVERDLA
mmetsp:Transcript_45875/g.127282  ORF Transcript_45875/g.127282 Transcript_45875/m.127282 type:complete len:267 (+) Transcript_45875:72-872(+)